MVGVFEDHVDHPGDRIGAVTCRSTVAQHFDMVHRRQRNGIQVCRGRTAPNRTAQVDEGAGMSTLAVDQHQHLVRRQAAQLRRTHQFGAVHQAWPGKLIDGISRANTAPSSSEPVLRRFSPEITSIGDSDALAVRSWARVPVTITVSSLGASTAEVSSARTGLNPTTVSKLADKIAVYSACFL